MALPDLRNLGEIQPDPVPVSAGLVFDVLQEARDEKGPRQMANESSLIRFSWAGECARALQYHIQKEPERPVDRPALLTFALGQYVHDIWQAGMQKFWGAEIEVKSEIAMIQASGHADAWLDGVAYEAKSINGFGFKQAVGAQGKAEGPRRSAILQGALNALALGAHTMKVVYISLEQISKGVAKRLPLANDDGRMSAEWTFAEEQWKPIAEAEVHRMHAVLRNIDHYVETPRHIPDMPSGARVTDPSRGMWELVDDSNALLDKGSVWQCGYCPFQEKCVADLAEGK